MATLVLGALGTLLAGPLGGALGALAGRQVDAAIIGRPTREGPRLRDLAIATSSYGQPIPQVFGKARVAGTVIWATDLVESRSTSGGGKGKPRVTSYSYTSSLAVALSSRPIVSIGRIWADGQLIRGAAGELKVAGTLRVHRGLADQPPDPLLAAAAGSSGPAYRNCAYVVFEDLQLADFGNRVPALSFEVFADDGPLALDSMVAAAGEQVEAALPLDGLEGFELAGGTLRDTLALLGELYPLVADGAEDRLRIAAAPGPSAPALPLPEAAVSGDSEDFGARTGFETGRAAHPARATTALRYYDPERDYQPGLQRLEGGMAAGESVTEFPATLTAASARGLLEDAAVRSARSVQRLRWRMAALDPALGPGRCVTVADRPGKWVIAEWEWRSPGIELVLDRVGGGRVAAAPADPGVFVPPPDLAPMQTWLHAFELPADGPGTADQPRRFLAVSAAGPGWQGAELLAETGGQLVTIGASGRTRATVGLTESALTGSPGFMIEEGASLQVALLAPDMALAPASRQALAAGANRLLVGDEVVQFAGAVPLGASRWRLEGLLRGRGGSEGAALRGHPPGTLVVLLDDALIPFEQLSPAAANAERFAALGLAGQEPVLADLANRGSTLRPLHPVHPRHRLDAERMLHLAWTRRARAAWYWGEGVEVPLMEDSERYLVGAGPPSQPLRSWETGAPSLVLAAADRVGLPPGLPLWVRQIGRHALSQPTLLATLP